MDIKEDRGTAEWTKKTLGKKEEERGMKENCGEDDKGRVKENKERVENEDKEKTRKIGRKRKPEED